MLAARFFDVFGSFTACKLGRLNLEMSQQFRDDVVVVDHEEITVFFAPGERMKPTCGDCQIIEGRKEMADTFERETRRLRWGMELVFEGVGEEGVTICWR